MKAIFSEFGTPHSIVSDNGPCYAAQYFADAMAEWGVNHIKALTTIKPMVWLKGMFA